MNSKYVLTEPAKSDLKNIWKYIAENNYDAANKFLRDLTAKFELLCANPKIGRRHDELLLNLLSFPFKNYVIFIFQTMIPLKFLEFYMAQEI